MTVFQGLITGASRLNPDVGITGAIPSDVSDGAGQCAEKLRVPLAERSIFSLV